MTLVKSVLACLAGAVLILASPSNAQDAPEVVGEWHGALAAPTGDLTLVLYVERAEDGALTAELESPDQAPGSMLPVSEITASDGRLAFALPPIGATYEGRWDAAAQAWRGTFTQGAPIPLDLAKGAPPSKPVITGLDGVWQGGFERNGVRLRQVLRISTGEKGTNVLFDSPDQLAMGIPVPDLTVEGDSVRFSTSRGLAKFSGTLTADRTQIAGTWTLPNQPEVAVTFIRAEATAAAGPPVRPQTPEGPFPYRVEDVTFGNPDFAEVRLAGTLTVPEGEGPFPAAIMITGSGGQDRDETIFEHKPFAVIADYLTRRGVAVLRYDDRGVGQSTGDYAAATTADLATDANAAFGFLRTRAEIRPDAIGFIGHSEGGLIAPIAMAGNDEVAFLVALAGPGTALDKLLLSQRRLVGAQMGLSEAELDRAEPVMAAIFRAIGSASSPEAGFAAAMDVLTPETKEAVGMGADMDGALLVRQVSGPWWRYMLGYDPRPNLARIEVPVLALNGSLDLQVPPKENLAAIADALSGNPDVTTRELPGLNHLFQTATTGAVGEYADIEETVSPLALDAIAEWLGQRFVAERSAR